ncbi:hypothetical protein [Saccharopolyspora endophytica]|uniref:2'-5' RNA ligase family protein n=1 Tax=Saccharopolyspora endophytica TaxID=543886 RepID=A0ABS5D9Y5_9PSEU|nr:hypothetical protein [Saccharopolyspora endophytica]MBQ0923093.1 hypothetical protein [Saccharopolyspora endophytica]
MRDFFSRHEAATWPEPERLHVYLRATDELRTVVDRYHEALRRTGIAAEHQLGLQKLEFVHFTVQMLSVCRREVPQPVLDVLITRLRSALTGVGPFSLRVGPPQASVHAVELWVDPVTDPAWERLVGVVRSGIAEVLGEGAMPPVASNGRPHTSLGYGYGDGDSGVLTAALKDVTPRPALVDVPVRELELVAVTQHPRRGQFTWDTVAVLPVGSGTWPDG